MEYVKAKRGESRWGTCLVARAGCLLSAHGMLGTVRRRRLNDQERQRVRKSLNIKT